MVRITKQGNQGKDKTAGCCGFHPDMNAGHLKMRIDCQSFWIPSKVQGLTKDPLIKCESTCMASLTLLDSNPWQVGHFHRGSPSPKKEHRAWTQRGLGSNPGSAIHFVSMGNSLFRTSVLSSLHGDKTILKNKTTAGKSLVVQWLRFHASSAGGMDLIPGEGTKIP